MGQGSYMGVVFGGIGDTRWAYGDDDNLLPWVESFSWSLGGSLDKDGPFLVQNYEGDTPWLGFPIADSEGAYGPGSLSNTAMTVDGFSEWLYREHGDAVEHAKAAWGRLREAGKEHGVPVPEGKLIIVFDYD